MLVFLAFRYKMHFGISWGIRERKGELACPYKFVLKEHSQ
jgi:hypothetical protein